MHVPFGVVSLMAGVVGAMLYLLAKVNGSGPDFTLIPASAAAFVAGWVACLVVPDFEKRLKKLERSTPPCTEDQQISGNVDTRS